MVRGMLLCGVVFFLGAGLVLAGGKGQQGKQGNKAHHTVHGVVEGVTQDSAGGGGVITVKVRHKKAGAAATTVERRVRVTPATKFFFVSGKKGSVQESPASFADVKAGERVAVTAHGRKGHAAEKVLIFKAKKKKA